MDRAMESKLIKTIAISSWPLVLFALNYFTSPLFVSSMFGTHMGQVLLIVGAIWLLIGAILYFLFDGKLQKLVFVSFHIPASSVFIIGPVILTILQALGVRF